METYILEMTHVVSSDVMRKTPNTFQWFLGLESLVSGEYTICRHFYMLWFVVYCSCMWAKNGSFIDISKITAPIPKIWWNSIRFALTGRIVFVELVKCKTYRKISLKPRFIVIISVIFFIDFDNTYATTRSGLIIKIH